MNEGLKVEPTKLRCPANVRAQFLNTKNLAKNEINLF